ncbi:MAG: adenylyltransferase/cytidyltransferase family protein [Patescibacteria group bacterium]
MPRVIVFGTFDVLHQGHHNFFRQAKKYGELFVVIARDRNVKKIKGQKPTFSEKTRRNSVAKLKNAEAVYLGNLSDPYKIIEKIKPDVIALGYDQNSFTKNLEAELKKRKISAKIIRLKPYQPHKYKSSRIKKAGRT